MKKGLYIVIQGVQGTGKTTQIDELERRLQAARIPVRKMREPDSQTDLTARNIRAMTQSPRYNMNTKTEVLLYNAARSQTLDVIRAMNDRGVTCIVDHSYLTTLAVQYYARGDIDDYDAINQIIRFTVADQEPDLILILDVPVDVSYERLQKRSHGEKFDKLSKDFLKRERDGLLKEAKKRNLPILDATQSVEALADGIWKHVAQALKQGKQPTSTVAQKSNEPTSIAAVIESKQKPLLKQNENQSFSITDAGREYLGEALTNVDDNVYVFTDKLSSTTVAAAMARLSRRGDDMRVTLLDEFADNTGKDEGLLKRVITAYGDDSVQQLAGVHFVVENASNWLTKKLEWGRLAAYLEQSTRYIYYDQKNEKGSYRYHTPPYFDAKTAKNYEQTMDKIFGLYSQVVRQLTNHVRTNSSVPKKEQDAAWKGATRAQACDAARPMLPVATRSTVGVFASGQALESLIMHLLADPMPEARETGKKLLEEARKVLPVFLERADKPDRGGAAIAYMNETKASMKRFADEYIPQQMSSAEGGVKLVDYYPRNELDLLPHMMYEHSNQSLEAIKAEIDTWDYNRKVKAFKTYTGVRMNRRHKPGRAMEEAHYNFEIVCDYGSFRDLQRHRMVDDLVWQELTPRYGYELPKMVEEAGLSDLFEKAFDMSSELYSSLLASGYTLEAQYATLLGHRMRWKWTYNARQAYHLHELRTSPQGHPNYRKVVNQLHEKLKEAHPLIAESMIFVNQDEDPELTRLAAERYTQFKLKKLDQQASKKKSR